MAALYTNGAAPFNLNLAAFRPDAGNGALNRAQRRARRSSHHRRSHNRESKAVLHALLAAQAYAAGWFKTLAEAAAFAGANVHYIRAALVLLKNGDDTLIRQVVRKNISMLSAFKQIEPQVRLIEIHAKASQENLEAYRRATGATADLTQHLKHASAEEKIAAGRNLGADFFWDGFIATPE